MGLFDRLKASASAAAEARGAASKTGSAVAAQLFSGSEDLELVGEASFQDALWSIARSRPGDRVRHEAVAALVPEPQNPHDANAISVQIDGRVVGYFAREMAVAYGPGLRALMEQTGGYIALEAVIVGGGIRADGPGKLGVWLKHDPADFGVASRPTTTRPAGAPVREPGGGTRTGLGQAWADDSGDDAYDLGWMNDLPDGDRPAIARLEELLASDPDPIDRHFQFAELERRLYRCRELYESALDEFDAVCVRHDSEMDVICTTFQAMWEGVPRLETYHQMAIRKQKQQDWTGCLWWVNRGLSLYGDRALRIDAVEDLEKRRNRAQGKLGSSPG